MTHGKVHVARIYDRADDTTGKRVLVDGMWPRGVRKDAARLDDWVKEVAPSTELRKWFGHDPARFEEFARRYRDELDTETGRQALDRLRAVAGGGSMTLLTATRDVEHSQARVLADLLSSAR